ncbi:MAG: hypothetical protein WC623_22545 [Pedobacter sp.]|uniref:hypothetical protein n=1 Tax=Pedobacter sp. TaxID=1411316 RepID=UPI00356A2D65
MTYFETPSVVNEKGKIVAKEHYEAARKSDYGNTFRDPIVCLSDIQSIYIDGQKSAEKLGDINDYTRVIYGVEAVLRSKGVNVSANDLANIYHMPLAMVPLKTPIDQISRMLEGELQRTVSGNPDYETTHGISYQNIRYLINKIETAKRHDPKTDENEIIESSIKHKFSKIRKNSKQYKEEVIKIGDRALELAKKNKEESILSAARDLKSHYEGTDKKTLSRVREIVKWINDRADVVEVFIPDSE